MLNLDKSEGASALQDARQVKSTRASLALSRIREQIVSGRLPPGERLIVANLAELIDAGQTPVREALMRLVSEGLVVQEEQKGFSVAPVSRVDLLDLTTARAAIESLLVQWSIERGDDLWESEVLGTLHRLRKLKKLAADGHTVQENWEERHADFHSALISRCGNQTLSDVRGMLYTRADRYRMLSVRYLQAPRDDVGEHERIAEAALARDVSTAVSLIQDHIWTTTEILLGETIDRTPHISA